jgi:hypothetical protein
MSPTFLVCTSALRHRHPPEGLQMASICAPRPPSRADAADLPMTLTMPFFGPYGTVAAIIPNRLYLIAKKGILAST